MDRKEADRGCRRLAKGESLSQALSRQRIFHPVFLSMVAAAEESGHLEAVLKQAGIYYEKAAEQSAVRMVTLLEPCMILIMAAVVGSIVLSIMLLGIQYVYSNVIKEDAMKHYIYLTEDKLYYIRKEKGARGYSFMGSRTITGPGTVTGAMESLADIYNLKGRAVVLAIKASVKIHFMSLPASSKKTALQMAEKQLLVLGEEGERLLAADFMPNNGQGMLKGTVYTVSEAWIRAIETGALITRFRIHSILPGPALLASFLEPSDYGMNKGNGDLCPSCRPVHCFYQMENGHCRHLEHSSLKPGMFAYLGEEKALMEEVAVLIRRFQTRMKQERREFQIQGVLIQGECLKAPRSDAGVLAKMLGIPCMALGKNGIWKRQALAGELKNLLYRNTGEFMEGESFYEKITEAGFPLGPVCASLVAFAVIVLSALGGQFYTAGKLERLDRISADQQGNDVTQERRDLEGKISELAKLTAEKENLPVRSHWIRRYFPVWSRRFCRKWTWKP